MALSKILNASVTDSTLTTTKLATPNLGRRNIIINGAMQCWQRATSASAIGYTSVDRWSYYAPSSLAISRSTDVPTGFQYATSVGGGGDSSGLTQKIEASTCKQLVGKTITVSFYLKQTTGSGTDKIAVALSRADSEDNFGGTTSISSQTISTTSSYARYTCTFASLPAEVANGLQLTIKSNGSGSVVYLITGVQVEANSQATPFEYRPYAEELTLCHRYFVKTNPADDNRASGVTGVVYSTTQAVLDMVLPVIMRAAPTVSIGGSNNSYWIAGIHGTASATIASSMYQPNVIWWELSSISGGSPQRGYQITYSGQVSIDAEL